MRTHAVTLLSSLLLLVPGCGDDGEGETGGTETAATATTMPDTATDSNTSTSGTTDPFTTTGTTSTSGSTTDPTATTDPTETTGPACDPADEEAINMCIDMALQQGNCEEVADCNCGSCVCELLSCEEDKGCVAIRTCAQETGCLGVACYTPENCMGVVDDAGGPGGEGAARALGLSNCNEGAGCPTTCEGSTGSSGGDTGGSDSGSGTAGTR